LGSKGGKAVEVRVRGKEVEKDFTVFNMISMRENEKEKERVKKKIW
jgi:hypothetical protein